MIIDVHGHISIAPEVLAYKSQISASRLNPDQGRPRISQERMAEYGRKHLDLLDAVGTDVQLISPRPFHAMHSFKPFKVAVEWNCYVNDVIAETCELFPTRYVGVAGLPQGSDEPLDRAIEELERCVRDLGFVGCLINPDPAEGGFPAPPGLGDAYWYPLYEKLCELDVPALVHSAACCAERESYTLHFINEESIAVVSLLESETFDRFPDLKIIIGHGGGAIPYQIARFEAWRSRANNPERFRDAMRKLYYDTCLYNWEGLDLLFRIVGTDRCLFGTELPGTGSAPDRDSGRQFDDLRPVIEGQILWLTDADKARLFEANARALFRLDERAPRAMEAFSRSTTAAGGGA
jgi:4-oxalmesaconate hydratase